MNDTMNAGDSGTMNRAGGGGMNKSIYIVIAIIILGALGFFLFGSKSGMMGGANATTTGAAGAAGANVAAAPSTPTGTMADIMARGGNQECSVTSTAGGQNTSGTVYVGGGKMRGNFTSQTQGGAIQSHMISDGQNVYVWSSLMTQGIEMSVAQAKSGQSSGAQQNLYNQQVNYSCKPWTLDAAQFTLPSGIKFTTMAQMTSGATAPKATSPSSGASAGANSNTSASGGSTSGSGASAPNCAMCDSAPAGESRDQCKAYFGCK